MNNTTHPQRLLLFAFFLALSLFARGQETLLFEDFDDVNPPTLPAGWTEENLSESGNTWVTYAVFSYSPPNCVSVFGNWFNRDAWLFSPSVDLEAGVSYRVSFYYRTSYSPIQMQVKMGTAPSPEDMDTQIWLNNSIQNTTYQEGFAIITPEEDMQVHFSWNVFESANNGSLYMDDVKVEEMEAVPEISLHSTSHNYGTISVNETAETTLGFTNLGGAPLTINAVDVSPPFYASYSGTLAPGESDELDIVFDPDTAGFFDETLIFDIEGAFEGDTVFNLTGHAYEMVVGFFEDFLDSDELPPGWSSIVESTGGSAGVTIYQAGDHYNHAYSGDQCARIFNATTEDVIIMITPELADVQGGVLSFYSKVPVFPEPLIIGTMSDSEDHNTFEPVDTIISQDHYLQYTFTFENAPSDHNYVAFKHGMSSNFRPIMVDDVSWTEIADLPPPQNLTATDVVGEATTLLQWDAPDDADPLGYNVYRNDNLINESIVEDTHFEDQDFEHEVSYTYHVTAIYPNGESAPSNEAEHTGDHGYRVITASAGDHGSITPEGSISVNYGEDQMFEVMAEEGYHIDQLLVDDVPVEDAQAEASYSYLFENVTENHEIHASFAINVYDVIYHADAGGSISGDAHQQVAHGTDASEVEAVPDTDYVFSGWSDGITDNPRTDANITEDLEVTALFESTVDVKEPGEFPVRVYPNPAKDQVTIDTGRSATTSPGVNGYKIFCMQGRVVGEGRLSGRLETISLRHLRPGSYVLRFYHDKHFVESVKIEKQ